MNWQDTENHMIQGDDEPIPTQPEDEDKWRQQDADNRTLAKLITDQLIKRMENGEFNP